MRIAITGATGFIGKYLVELLKTNNELLVLTSKDYLPSIDLFKGLDYCNINDHETIAAKFKNVDALIHLAAQRPLKNSPSNFNAYKGNVQMMTDLLDICKNAGVNTVVNVSTKAVYGKPGESAFDEDDELDPVSFYGLSKVMAEQVCDFYSSNFGMNCISLRLGQVIGWGEKNRNVFTVCLDNALAKKEQTLWGKGTGARTYVYVKDVLSAIECSINSTVSGAFNVSFEAPTSNHTIAETVNTVFENDGILHLMDKPEDLSVESMDISKATEVLGWKPAFATFNEALVDMKNDYECNSFEY